MERRKTPISLGYTISDADMVKHQNHRLVKTIGKNKRRKLERELQMFAKLPRRTTCNIMVNVLGKNWNPRD